MYDEHLWPLISHIKEARRLDPDVGWDVLSAVLCHAGGA